MTPMATCQVARRRRSGLTLVELISATAIAGILCLTLTGVIAMAGRAVPDPSGPLTGALISGRVVDRISTELESAMYVIDRGTNRIAFTVADRDGDGKPERIRYTWSGVGGESLMRQYNDNAPVAIVDKVDLFTITAASKSVGQSYRGLSVEDAAESLLVDKITGSGLGSYSTGPTDWTTQYFSPTLTADVVAWRPTRFKLMAMKDTLVGSSSMQLRPADATFKPTATVMEQYTLNSNGLTTYTYLDFPLSTTVPQAPGAGMCMVIAYASGGGPLYRTNSGVAQLTSSDAGVTWSYQNTKAMVFQMYGKVSRSGATQYVNSRYFTSIGIALRAGAASNAAVRTSSVMLNHPEYLSNLLELKFDSDATKVDTNGDAQWDWVPGGAAWVPGSVAGGKWTATVASLNSTLGSDLANVSVIDLRFRSTTVTASPGLTVNALRSGSTCAPLSVYLQLQLDGTQTLTVTGKTSDSASLVLLNKPGLSIAAHDVRLILDPAVGSVGVLLDTVSVGTFALPWFNSSDSSRTISLVPGNGGEFQYVRVRELDPNP